MLINSKTCPYLRNALYAALRVALLSCLDKPCILCKAAGIQEERHTMLLADVRCLHMQSFNHALLPPLGHHEGTCWHGEGNTQHTSRMHCMDTGWPPPELFVTVMMTQATGCSSASSLYATPVVDRARYAEMGC